jgi:hypothetical protein
MRFLTWAPGSLQFGGSYGLTVAICPPAPICRPGKWMTHKTFILRTRLICQSGNKRRAATVSLVTEDIASRCCPVCAINAIQGERQCSPCPAGVSWHLQP